MAGIKFSEEHYQTLEQSIDRLTPELTELSQWLHKNPELGYKEYKAHEKITNYFDEYIKKSPNASNFKLTRSCYGLETAFEVIFTSPKSGKGPSVGFNSEYDALPEIGHACGHSLIAVAGISAFLGVSETMAKHNLPGKCILLGTPAEEGYGGKIDLLKAGAYKGMDTCMMTHPIPCSIPDKPTHTRGMNALARQRFRAKFKGHPAHASAYPWEGRNALDAAVLSYQAIATLRQQIQPNCRVHCIIPDGGSVVNVIPDSAELALGIRAPKRADMLALKERCMKTITGATAAAHCEVEFVNESEYYDVVTSEPLGDLYESYLSQHPQHSKNIVIHSTPDKAGGSTDFGQVSYAMPGIHPVYGITSEPGCANHTRGFTKYADTPFAHQQNFLSAKGIAAASLYVLLHNDYFDMVIDDFKAKGLPMEDP